jgi:CBS domain-containing protein
MNAAPTIDKSAFLSDAMLQMDKENTRRLIATRRGKLYGLLTLREIMRVLGSRRKGSKSASSLRVATAVVQNFARVLPDENEKNCITLLRTVDSLVVMDDDSIQGIIIPINVIAKFSPAGPAAQNCSHPPTVDISDRLVHARRVMLDNSLSRLPVTDGGKLVSMVTERDIAVALYELREAGIERHLETRLESMIIGDIVRFNMVTAPQDTTMVHVSELMVENDIGGVPLVDSNGTLMGVVTRRDVIRAI